MGRVYKEEHPINTVLKIRTILAGLQMMPIEKSWYHPYKEIYSVRLVTSMEDGAFGSNGKGRNVNYTLASAYAEYIERLQNGYLTGVYGFSRLFLELLKKKHGYYYFPDEYLMTQDYFIKLPQKYLLDLFNGKDLNEVKEELESYFVRLKENGLNGVTSVPFYDVKNGEIIYLPYNLTITMTASNGMAAGNTNYECIFQGLCEILERYVTSTIYYNQLTPPSIPKYFFSQVEEFKIIEEIEQAGYIVDVKDFSCGEKIPAVGVIIINKRTNKYKLNIGVDTSFSVALSRALTEIHQGLGSCKTFEDFLLPIPTEEHDYFKNNTPQDLFRRSFEIKKFIINGQGIFPKSLFNKESSYKFDESIFIEKDCYEEEVSYLCNLLIKRGYDIYVRDVSFLGFPSCYIYIPQLSLLGRKSISDVSNSRTLIETTQLDSLEDLLLPIENLEKKTVVEKVLTILSPNREDIYSGVKIQDLLKLEFDDDFYWSKIPLNFLLSILTYIVDEYTNTKMYLLSFMKETSNENDTYYNEVIGYLELLESGFTIDEIRQKEMVTSDIIASFSSIKSIFADILWPNCPNCDNCKLIDYCLTNRKYLIADRIMTKMKTNYESQNMGGMYLDLSKIATRQ